VRNVPLNVRTSVELRQKLEDEAKRLNVPLVRVVERRLEKTFAQDDIKEAPGR
jgi:hypothetical protein